MHDHRQASRRDSGDPADQRDLGARYRSLLGEFEAILDGAADGIMRLDGSGAITYVNAAAEEMLGWPREQLIGRTAHDAVHRSAVGSPHAASDCRIVLSCREGVTQRVGGEVFWRKNGTGVPIDYVSSPVWDAGLPAGAVLTFRDVSDQRAVEEQLRRSRDVFRTLAHVSTVLGEAPLDPHERLRLLACEFVPSAVDWCAVDLLSESGDLERVIVEHVDPRKVEVARQLQERYPADPASATGAWEVMRTGRPQLIESISDELIRSLARDDEHLAMLRSLNLRSALILPMTAADSVLGVISLVTAESGRMLTQEDVPLYREIAARAGSLINSARLYEERSRVAKALQQSLLPPVLPAIDGVHIAARYVSATSGIDVGGDFYDIFPTDPGDWVVVLGDVSGKGAEAAAMTALVRHTIRAAAIGARKPAAVLGTLNRAVYREETERFCTACYVRVRPSPSGIRLTVGRAGHPRPLLLRAGGRLEEIAAGGGTVGLFPTLEISDRAARLKPGDSLILFTDGVTEARGDRGLLGERTLRAFVRSAAGKSAEEIAEGIEHLAMDWQQGRPRDDIAIVVIQAPRSETESPDGELE